MSNDDFIKIWNKEDSVQAVADRIGKNYHSVATKASRLRKAGYTVPKKTPSVEYLRKIAAKGGRNGTTGGFYVDRELASRAGRKGGSVSKRKKNDKHATLQTI